MKQNTLFVLIYWLLGGMAFAGFLGSYGCASIGSPLGGSRDSIAPVLVKANPENFTPSFKSKSIVLTFDEYVDVASVFEKLIINPAMEKFPLVDRKLKTVTIRLKDTLEANTTYSFRFDDVIKDVNEGNPLGDFTYVFSTGTRFDSASFSGRVMDAETGKVDSTLIVLLHNNLSDTAITKLKPRYVTKLDGKGFFRFSYLAPGSYNVFALKDEGVKRYNDSTLPFAFHDRVIEVGDSTNPVEMLFFKAKKENKTEANREEEPKPGGKKPGGGEEGEERPKGLEISFEMGMGGTQDILKDLVLKANRQVVNLDSTKIIFTDTLNKPAGPFSLKPDSTGKTLVLKHKWKLETWYQLVLLKGFASDSAGITNRKNDTLLFRTKGEADYGSVKIDFTGLDQKDNPVLCWLEGETIVKSIPLKGGTFSDKLFKPGEYEIRILLDRNKNGVWDTGDYWKRLQPERVLSIGKKLSIRANWDNEFAIDVNAPEDPDKK